MLNYYATNLVPLLRLPPLFYSPALLTSMESTKVSTRLKIPAHLILSLASAHSASHTLSTFSKGGPLPSFRSCCWSSWCWSCCCFSSWPWECGYKVPSPPKAATGNAVEELGEFRWKQTGATGPSAAAAAVAKNGALNTADWGEGGRDGARAEEAALDVMQLVGATLWTEVVDEYRRVRHASSLPLSTCLPPSISNPSSRPFPVTYKEEEEEEEFNWV